VTATVRINGTDIGTTLGWYPDDLPQWLSPTPRSLTANTLHRRSGVFPALLRSAAPRVLGIKGTLTATSLANRRTAERQIADLVYGGEATITVDDGTTALQTTGVATALSIVPFGVSLAPLALRIEAEFTCPDPTWRESEPTSQILGATRQTLALGTAPSTPIIRIMGSATNPVLTYRNAGGTAIKTCTFTVTLAAADDWLDIDMRTGLCVLSDNAVTSNGLSYLSAGDFPWAFDPQDGDYGTSAWPTLEVSAGTGVAYWWKRYL
jgi:hypothetical protein